MRRRMTRRVLVVGVGITIIFLVYFNTSSSRNSTRNNQDVYELDITKQMAEAERDIAKRLQHVQQTCRKYNLGLYKHNAEPPLFKQPPVPQYGVYYIDKKHKLSWCPIYKSGSTTWLYNFCLLGGYTEDFLGSTKQQLSEVARKIFPNPSGEEAEQAFQSTLKFMVVRHPFERLLSAYRDKLENTLIGKEHGVEHYYKKYGRKIVEKYRKSNVSSSVTHYVQEPGLPPPAGIEPTFPEFVEYLINLDVVLYSDDHWIPYYLYCTPCLLNYDIIAKVETLQRDQLYVIQAAGLQDLIRPRWQHVTKGRRTHDVSPKYFSQLTRDQILRLYEKYRLDFELFNYGIDEYIQYAKTYREHQTENMTD